MILVVLLKVVYVLVCFCLAVVILMQSGKGGGVSGAFGIGGASQTLFGASGAGTFLTRATAILGGAFMLMSLLLALLAGAEQAPTRRSVLQPGPGAELPISPATEAPVGGSAPITAQPGGTPMQGGAAGAPGPVSPAPVTGSPAQAQPGGAPAATGTPPGTSGATGQ